MIAWRDVSLLGIDVGYSTKQATTGIAVYRFGQALSLHCVRFDANARQTAFAHGPLYDAVAIDGPLVLPSFNGVRECERVLSRGTFGRRCKAGFSHFGEGAKLRAAANVIASDCFDVRQAKAPLVEAFPNAFLGVLLDDAAYAALPNPIPRGTKSDLFFARAAADKSFDRLFDHLGWHDDALKAAIQTWALPPTRVAHDIRAAIICVLTAGCALANQHHPIGDSQGGFIALPPLALWADWARDALVAQSFTSKR